MEINGSALELGLYAFVTGIVVGILLTTLIIAKFSTAADCMFLYFFT